MTNTPETVLGKLLNELPAEERAVLLEAIRKANIPDENDILFHLIYIHGLFAKIHHQTATTIAHNVNQAQQLNPTPKLFLATGLSLAFGVMAGALCAASLAQGLVVLGIAAASAGLGYLLGRTR